MAQIDKFIEALHRCNAENLEVTPGAQVMLGVNGSRRPATNQPVTEDQVTMLLREILPSGATAPSDGQQFTYGSPSGAVRVAVSRSAGAYRLLIHPVDQDGAAESSPGSGDAPSPTSPDSPAAQVSVGPPGSDADAKARIDRLFKLMVDQGCSDLHLSTGSPPMLRKAGEMVTVESEEPLSAEDARSMLLSITPPHRLEDYERTHDSDFAYEMSDLARFRCNLFVDRRGMGGVFRVIPAKIMTVEDLGLSKQIIELCNLSKGLVVVTGPTGSGKSTTLAALLDYINRTRSDHVVTIEDPIEFVHPNKRCLINQREVGVHTDSFKVALRAALREDPDVVLVGEMRDLETVAIAIETAETGHLVFGTLHTNTAASTVDRIIDQFSADRQSQIRTMLSESLRGVISQTLVKTKTGRRVAALEFLLVTTAVSNLIREGKTYQIPSAMQTGKQMGMRTLNDALLEFVKNGSVAPEEAYFKSVEKAELESMFSRNGISLQST
jgi:twitching motility protein PilT